MADENRRIAPALTVVHGLFEARAQSAPDAVAVVSPDGESLTYGELDRRAGRLARHLRRLGVGPETPVGILLDRSPRLVEALLAVLKAGGFYVPVDPFWPADRLAFLAEDSRAALWLSESSLAGRVPAEVPADRVVLLDRLEDEDSGEPLPAVLPDQLAYAIYTSGSTGRPKGVQIPHRAVVNFLESMRQRPGLDASDVLLAVTTASFDIAVLELFLPLTVGARVVVAPRAAAADAGALTELMERFGVTVLQATPATWRLLLAAGWPGRAGLRILCGGEALPPDLAAALLERGSELWNLYGPTETTVWSAVHPVARGESPVPLGEPIGRTDLRLLAPDWETPEEEGELGIGGAGLSRGYLRRPDLTAERFIPHPGSPEPGARLYRTGDLVRATPAGLQFLGRIDHQVKIRGYRIELGEIEAALRGHPGVGDAVVVAREAAPGDLRLAGYVVPSAGFAEAGQDGWQAERVDQWREVYDQASDLSAIWKSSYTGEPLPEEELRASHEATVARLLSLKPDRVLEIGCGTGPILLGVVPHVSHYCGTDFSEAALAVLRDRLGDLSSRVRLLHRPADDLSGLEPGSFDLVVLNSVAQYFPSLGYLLGVIEGALGLLRPGGFLYLGDLRSLPLLEAFAASVRLFQAPFSLPVSQLLVQVRRQVEREPELLLDPALVGALRERFPAIRRGWTWLKRGRKDNELTRFRYDAVLEVGEAVEEGEAPVELVWGRDVAGLDDLVRFLEQDRPAAVSVRGVPNARVVRDLQALRLMREPGGPETGGALREMLARGTETGVHPEDFWALEDSLPYTVHVGTSVEPGGMEVLLESSPPVPLSRGGVGGRWERGTGGEVRPLAELASDPLRGKVAAALVPALRAHLRERLPEYMVPSTLVVMAALPLTPNRKVDRSALPAPDLSRAEGDDYLAPRNAVEREVARVFADVLGVERVGVRDDFFEMGGHSLLGTQLTYRLRDGFGVDLPLNVLFEAPTVEALAARIGEREEAGREVDREADAPLPLVEPDAAARFEPFPLNDIQQAYWIGRTPGLELGGVACRFYQQFAARGIDLDRLERAWQRVVERHGMLRAVVAPDGTQRILERVPPYRIRVAESESLEEVRHRLLHELRPPEEWPLFGVEAHRLEDGSLRIHVLLELLVVDGLSILTLFEEWGRFYADPELELPPLRLSFRDYVMAEAELERSARFARARGYWMQRLPALPPPPALPLARNPASLGRPEFVRHGASLPAGLWRRLKERAQRAGLWPSALLCAAYAEVLRVWSREPSFTLNLTLFNRLPVHPEVNRILGDFTTLDLLEVDGRAGETFAERARALQARLFLDLENRAFSGVKVLRELARVPGSTARMPVVFTSFLEDFSRTDWLGPVVDRLGQTPQVWLDHVILERAGVLELDWYAVEALFPPGMLPAMFEAYAGLLRRLAEGDAAWSEARPVRLPTGELVERELANATAAPVPQGRLQDPFLARALQHPDRPAVISPARTLTHGELRERASLLAERLREAGARPDELVAVVMRKGWAQVVAVMAILEAGAAYLPLDAGLPPARLAALLERGGARIALAQESRDVEWPAGIEVIRVGGKASDLTAEEGGGFLPPGRGWVGSGGRPGGGRLSDHALSPGTLPEEEGASPEGQGASAETRGVTPEGRGASPEAQGAAPWTLAAAPEGQGAFPEVAGASLTGQGAAPRRPGMAPEGEGVAPGGSGEAPEAQGGSPCGQGVAPYGQGEAPEAEGEAPYGEGEAADPGIVAFGAPPSWPPPGANPPPPRGEEPPPSLDSRLASPGQGGGSLAYVLFTSGSTGVPKGVMIDHRGALNTVVDVNTRFGVGPDDRVLGLSSLGFDLSVYDIFGVLGAGGTLVLPAAEDRNEPARWAELVCRERITVWNSVPALLDLMLDELDKRPDLDAGSLRLVMLSGDWIPLSLPERLRRHAPGAEVISLGGATEASIWSILHPVGEVAPDWRSIPYGRPMANQTFHVLDAALEPCPVWVPGHLYIGGIGLALGYWRDEERTRESFLVHPRTGERLYRTGDLGRYLPGGVIEFLGREDGQVKIQGNRVELGEIESVLALHPDVHAAAAAARGPRDGARRLLAWYVPVEGAAPDPIELRAFLAERLPAYMVPSRLVPVPALPLSANGKVDRAALPEPEGEENETGRLAPRDPVERVLAGLASTFLDGARVGAEDNFFAVGGNSLTAIRLIARLRDRFHVEMPVARFFDAPTVSGLAGSLLHCQVAEHGEETVEALLREVEALPDERLDEALSRELGLLAWEDA